MQTEDIEYKGLPMKIVLPLSMLLLASTLGCATVTSTIDIGRGSEDVYVPDAYSAESPAPLVLLLHGYTSNSKMQERYMRFNTLVDDYNYILVAPNGTKEESKRKVQFWNATMACCNFHGSDVNDVQYLRDLIAEVRDQYSIDPNRIYLIGHSNGGFMSHRMAYEYPDLIAGIASLAGAAPLKLEGPAPKRPVAILQIHGTDDGTIKYEGGEIGDFRYPSAEETVEKWAEFYGFDPEDKTTLDDKIDIVRGPRIDETIVTQYGDGTVQLWTIPEGKHIPGVNDGFRRGIIEFFLENPKK